MFLIQALESSQNISGMMKRSTTETIYKTVLETECFFRALK